MWGGNHAYLCRTCRVYIINVSFFSFIRWIHTHRHTHTHTRAWERADVCCGPAGTDFCLFDLRHAIRIRRLTTSGTRNSRETTRKTRSDERTRNKEKRKGSTQRRERKAMLQTNTCTPPLPPPLLFSFICVYENKYMFIFFHIDLHLHSFTAESVFSAFSSAGSAETPEVSSIQLSHRSPLQSSRTAYPSPCSSISYR